MEKNIRIGDIVFWLASAFLFGVFTAGDDWDMHIVLGAGLIITTAVLFFSKKSVVWKYPVAIFCAGLIGVLYYQGYVRWTDSHVRLPVGRSAAFLGSVTDDPEHAGNFTLLKVALSRPYSGTIDIFASPNSQFHYGDMVWARGKIMPSNDADEDPALFLPELRVLSSNNGFWLKRYSIVAKTFIIKTFGRFFSSDKAALLSAIVTGSTDALSADLKSQMNDSGTSYMVGMYGYKIALIGFFMSRLLKDLLSRKALLFFTLGSIATFIFFSGGSVSALRAGIMGSLALLAAALGRKFVARNALTLTAFLIALFDPRVLTEAAFQLSFLSYLGIYHLGTPLRIFFGWDNDGFLEWKQHAMLSLSTNLAIIPVVISTFGGFSLTSFISNVLIMIPWALIIFFALTVLAIGSWVPPLAFFFILIVNFLLGYELLIIHIFAKVMIPMPSIFTSDLAIIFYYGILFLFVHYYGETA